MIENRLRVLCAERRISLRQLAQRAGLHETTIYRFADDRNTMISKATLAAVCEELGVTPGDVFIYKPGDDGRGPT
jgi:putative transcriptional regulator